MVHVGESSEPQGRRLIRLVGVYHASGTPWGEVSYWLKARFGGGHCALCDITHGTFREKERWKQCRTDLAVPFDAVHLDEQDEPLAAFTDGRTPCVVAETSEGLVLLVDDAELRSCDGSPDALVTAIERELRSSGLGPD